ncbi:GNAT family N-acetyltransferase [Bartonella vinsonii]|uniref:Predicted acetyltransferase n=1 Tax=Bartonella vinsonii TaxID=33047 RepID=A0A3S5A0Z6_BARVI|nr:N-acetyltransferase [Bartonella vinsonii]VEJ45828.1 Predicted acetyltransferase [Bartonella vinsonii]
MDMLHFQTKDGALFTLSCEQETDKPHREHLLDLVLGEGRKRKSSEALRRGRLAALSFVVKNMLGELVGSVRLWHVRFNKGQNDTQHALLLGPLAVSGECSGMGIGSVLMQHAIEEARMLGYGAILLVGDCAFYQRFGFSNSLTKNLAMPGPYEKHRFQALELIPEYLSACYGVLAPSGKQENLSCFQHHKVA